MYSTDYFRYGAKTLVPCLGEAKGELDGLDHAACCLFFMDPHDVQTENFLGTNS